MCSFPLSSGLSSSNTLPLLFYLLVSWGMLFLFFFLCCFFVFYFVDLVFLFLLFFFLFLSLTFGRRNFDVDWAGKERKNLLTISSWALGAEKFPETQRKIPVALWRVKWYKYIVDLSLFSFLPCWSETTPLALQQKNTKKKNRKDRDFLEIYFLARPKKKRKRGKKSHSVGIELNSLNCLVRYWKRNFGSIGVEKRQASPNFFFRKCEWLAWSLKFLSPLFFLFWQKENHPPKQNPKDGWYVLPPSKLPPLPTILLPFPPPFPSFLFSLSFCFVDGVFLFWTLLWALFSEIFDFFEQFGFDYFFFDLFRFSTIESKRNNIQSGNWPRTELIWGDYAGRDWAIEEGRCCAWHFYWM